MAETCPRCGFEALEGPTCPRCGVDAVRYRADIGLRGPRVELVREHGPATPGAAPLTLGAGADRGPAGFWIRVVAVLIDGVALTAAQAILAISAWVVFGRESSGRPVRAALNAVSLLLGIAYPIVFHWQWGQTLGKMAVHIRVVTLAGGPLTLGQATLRQIGSWLSALIFGIGYLMVGLRADKRGLHDLIAGTRVERTP
jgi:uncharacterized RDD family membrane protein YckC